MMADHLEAGRLHDRFPTLRQVGIAAERFQGFVQDHAVLHHLDVVLLTFALAGRGRHVMGDVVHEIVVPSVAVTAVGEQHSLVTEGEGLDVVNVFLDPDLHPLPALRPPLDEALATLVPLPSAPGVATTPIAQLELRPADRYEPLLDLLVSETERPRSLDLLVALRTSLLATCAHALLDRGLTKPSAPRSHADSRITGVREWLDHHYLEQHTLTALAARAHLERTYFSARFSKVVGLSCGEYLARLRIRYAVGLLQTTTEPVAAVARASGFGDLSNFGRTFRRLVGVSPRRFRAESRTWRADGVRSAPDLAHAASSVDDDG